MWYQTAPGTCLLEVLKGSGSGNPQSTVSLILIRWCGYEYIETSAGPGEGGTREIGQLKGFVKGKAVEVDLQSTSSVGESTLRS